MTDPLSATSALVGLVTFSYQASKALRDTVKSYHQHPKYVRELKEELSALEDILLLLKQSLLVSSEGDYALLKSPVLRCGRACEEFKQALQRCSTRSRADTSSFRDWLKIRWMGSDIHGFKDALAGYKSTIAIAIAGVNLRTSKTSLDVILEYQDMIRSTKTDLQDHLCDIDEKLRDLGHEMHLPEDSVDRNVMVTERESTIRSLEICVQVSDFIEAQQKHMSATVSDSREHDSQAGTSADSLSARQILSDSLQGCRVNIRSANAQLANRLRYLSIELNDTSAEVVQSTFKDRDKMAKEVEDIRQCLDICTQAAEDADKARTNIMDDVTTAEDSRQILVSTIGDLIAAHRITAGPRSLQAIGQMSDATLQQISRTHGNSSTESSRVSTVSTYAPDTSTTSGRTLGSSNVRTL